MTPVEAVPEVTLEMVKMAWRTGAAEQDFAWHGNVVAQKCRFRRHGPGWQMEKNLKKSIRDKVHRPGKSSYSKKEFGATSTANESWDHQLSNPGLFNKIA